MVRKHSSKKIMDNNRKGGSRYTVQRNASPVKIAYYVQRMLEKKMETKEIILIISSQFGNDDVREFAKMYRYCFYREDIRRIANLIYNISKKNMNEAMNTVLRDILIKKEILPSDYIREHSSDQQKKINIKVL
jgi:hypothetical protein